MNIAERVITMAKQTPTDIRFDYNRMAEKSESMLKRSLDAIVNLDDDLAYKVCLDDDDVDDMNRYVYEHVKETIRQNPEHVNYLINLMLVSRHLERIADHATNIAEEVIYVVGGVIHRHNLKEITSPY